METYFYSFVTLKTNMYDLSHVMRKPVFGIFDQVRLKPACSATDAT